MARISIDAAVGAGFRVIGRAPGSFVVWCLVYLLLALLPAAWMLTQLGPLLAEAARGAQTGAAPLAAVQAELSQTRSAAALLPLLAQIVLTGAVFRAVLEPERRAAFYLRLGEAEVWMALAAIVLSAFLVAVSLILSIRLIFALVVALVSPGSHPHEPLIGGIAPVAILVAAIWVLLRLSMGPVMSFAERGFRLFDSWAFTRGQVLVLLAVAVSLMVIAISAEVVVFAIGAFLLDAVWPLPDLGAALARDPQAVAARIPAGLVLGLAVVLAAFSTWIHVMFCAAWAEMYRALKPAPADRP